MSAGIETRHRRGCASRSGGRCDCKPSFQANVWSARDRKRIRKTFPTVSAAKRWRADAVSALAAGTLRASTPVTLRQAADAWLAGAEDGAVRTRSGDRYKPSALRGYRAALEQRVLPALGGARLADVRRVDLQDLADRLLAEGLDPSTIRNTLMPVRAIYRRAVARGDVGVNPTAGLELPAVRGRRERIVSPEQADRLLVVLAPADRALWATALYAGLRRGELMALRWRDVDFDAAVVRVERSYDPKAREFIEPKSRAGRRTVPLVATLRLLLGEHRLRCGRRDGLVFGRDGMTPFDDSSADARAKTAWKNAGLEPLTLHEARHTFASLSIAAGVNAKALATYMGHASVTITYDRYGHLMPGNENQAAELLEAHLERSRARQLRDSPPTVRAVSGGLERTKRQTAEVAAGR